MFRKLPEEVQFYYIPTVLDKLFLFGILELAHEWDYAPEFVEDMGLEIRG